MSAIVGQHGIARVGFAFICKWWHHEEKPAGVKSETCQDGRGPSPEVS